MTFPIATIDDLLQVWRSGLARDYARGIEFEDDGFGFDIVTGQAAIFARVAQAFGISSQAYYLRPHSSEIAPSASGAAYAVGEIVVRRSPPASGAIVIGKGTSFTVQVHDPTGTLIDASAYVATSDVTFADGDLGPHPVPVTCTRLGYQGNVPAGRPVVFTPAGTFDIPGDFTASALGANTYQDSVGVADRIVPAIANRYVRIMSGPDASATPRRILTVTLGATGDDSNTMLIDGPAVTVGSAEVVVQEWADLGLTCALESPLEDGVHGWLDAIGEERLCFRQVGESDDDYLKRILAISDVVSPGAIMRAAVRILQPAGITFSLIEAGDAVNFSGFEWTPTVHLATSGSTIGLPASYNFATMVRFFALKVSLPTHDSGSYTDVYQGSSDTNYIDGEAITDGWDYAWDAALQKLFAQVNQIKSGGVGWAILLDIPLPP